MISKLSDKLKGSKFKIIIKDYFSNIDEVLQDTSMVISRAGAGTITDLLNYGLQSILIPLPTAKDNHQYYNALIMHDHKLAIIIDQKRNELPKAKKYIYKVYNNFKNLNLINEKFDKIKVKNSNSLIYSLIINEK